MNEIRPRIHLTVDKPIVDKLDTARESIRFKFSFNMPNIGRGPAVRPSVRFAIPYRKDEETGSLEQVSSGAENLPSLLPHGSSHEGIEDIFIEPSVDMHQSYEEFLEVECCCEDFLGNGYQIVQIYRLTSHLLPYGKTWVYYLSLGSEDLFFKKSKQRWLKWT